MSDQNNETVYVPTLEASCCTGEERESCCPSADASCCSGSSCDCR